MAMSADQDQSWPEHPVVHEINTAVWLGEVARRAGRTVTLADVPGDEWDAVVPAGIDVVWLMGVWTRSPAGREVALADDALRRSWSEALPDWTTEDVLGSPYCIREYVPDPAWGGWSGLDLARAELRRRGARLMVDWVPNHTGPDSPWLSGRPDAYVHGTASDLEADPRAFLDVGGTIVARGRDPFFAPWPDVVQLDPFADSYRRLALETLTRIAEHADAVRCDMAMLMLDDVVQRTWGDRVGAPPERTYWDVVVGGVRSAHPQFRFVAEAYWDREWDLQQVGFDFCYDKRLYDRMRDGPPASVRGHLDADLDYQRKLVRFLENHDEPRAASTFAPLERTKALAVAVATLPGMTLWHEGEAEGRHVFLPVFLGRRPEEPLDAQLSEFHHALWSLAPSVRSGRWERIEVTGWPDNTSCGSLLAWSWADSAGVVLVVVNLAGSRADGMAHLDGIGHDGPATFVDLLSGEAYALDAAAVAREGLYVGLDAWGAQVLSSRGR
jgi:hypothetical protein